MRSPLAAFPGSAIAGKGDAASKSITIATGRMWFIIDLQVAFAASAAKSRRKPKLTPGGSYWRSDARRSEGGTTGVSVETNTLECRNDVSDSPRIKEGR